MPDPGVQRLGHSLGHERTLMWLLLLLHSALDGAASPGIQSVFGRRLHKLKRQLDDGGVVLAGFLHVFILLLIVPVHLCGATALLELVSANP